MMLTRYLLPRFDKIHLFIAPFYYVERLYKLPYIAAILFIIAAVSLKINFRARKCPTNYKS